jgi:hypothetical protein
MAQENFTEVEKLNKAILKKHGLKSHTTLSKNGDITEIEFHFNAVHTENRPTDSAWPSSAFILDRKRVEEFAKISSNVYPNFITGQGTCKYNLEDIKESLNTDYEVSDEKLKSETPRQSCTLV